MAPYFEREKVSPMDVVWDKPRPVEGLPPLPKWQWYTDTLAAPPVGARPFFLTGAVGATVAPFADVPVPGLSLNIQLGDVCILKTLVVWKLRGGTLDPPAAASFWTLALDGAPVGDGWNSVYTFGIGGSPSGLNGLFLWPVDIRITTPGALAVSITIQDPAMAGSNISYSGIMSGWAYPADLDRQLDTGNAV